MKSKLIYAEFHEFIGLYNGLNANNIVLDFSKMDDVEIVLFLGDNGFGKSTVLCNLHALTESADGRDIIRVDKNGKKIIKYRRSDNVEFECKILYFPTKTGHSCKAYVKKINGSDETELNPTGNITSYDEVIEKELGLNKYILKLLHQSSDNKGYVNLTSMERKNHMIKHLPIDEYSLKYLTVNKTYREFKTRMNILVDNLGRMMTSEAIEESLNAVTKMINKLVSDRDKTRDKINEIKTRINMIYEEGDIEKLYKQIHKSIEKAHDELNDTLDKIRESFNYVGSIIDKDATIESIDSAMVVIHNNISKYQQQLAGLESTLSMNRERRNRLSQDISSKKSILDEFMSAESLDDLERLLVDYQNRYDELDKSVGKVYTKYTIDDLHNGYDIVTKFRNTMELIWGDDVDKSKSAISDFYDGKYTSEMQTLEAKKSDLLMISHKIQFSIDNIEQKSNLRVILQKRPTECKIDDCPFIIEALQWSEFEKERDRLTELQDKNQKEIRKLNERLEWLSDVNIVKQHITYMMSFREMNQSLINRLPNNNEFSSKEALFKAIEKGSSFHGADKYDWYLEALSNANEYLELKTIKIPNLSNEIKSLRLNDKMITHTKNEYNSLMIEYDSIVSSIREANKLKEDLVTILEKAEMLLEKMQNIRVNRLKFNELSESIETDKLIFKDIEKKREMLISLEDGLREYKSELKAIEDELEPLSRKRELYKLEQLKLVSYQTELEAVKNEMHIVEMIRDSLSPKEGLPIEDATLYMDQIRMNANTLLSYVFKGSLYLEEFDVDEKVFRMPFKRLGDVGKDVKDASSAERSFIALALMLAMVETVIDDYGIMYLDEVDAGFSEDSKFVFVKILEKQMKQVGITQAFLSTHNREFYEGFSLGYVLFPGHNLPNSEKRNNPYIELST